MLLRKLEANEPAKIAGLSPPAMVTLESMVTGMVVLLVGVVLAVFARRHGRAAPSPDHKALLATAMDDQEQMYREM